MGVTKNSVIAAAVLLLCMPRASAALVITEIMFDLPGSDAGREWIEVYNDGTHTLDLTKLRLFEHGTNHKIAATGGETSVPANSYAIIADNPTTFEKDWPAFSGMLFDSTFSLSNEGETISITDASSTVLNSAVYANLDAGDGNSLNREGSEPFALRAPSPGAPMSQKAIVPLPKESPAPAKKPKSPTGAKASVSKEATSMQSEPEISKGEEMAAVAIPTTHSSPFAWVLGVAALALACAATVIVGGRFKKEEWDITEGI